MKKKNRFKSWLIKVLHNWLAKLEPYHNVVKVEHTHVPLVTLDASVVVLEHRPLPEDRINEILAQKLGEEIMRYADIEQCTGIEWGSFDNKITYRATIKVAADK